MEEFPSIPSVEDAPASLFETGHLWIQELVDGLPLRFRIRDSGRIVFGDETGVFRGDDIPTGYGHAVRHVRDRFDRDALRSTVDDPESVVFAGTATVHRTIDYDWDRLPSFLGHDILSDRAGGLLPPDSVDTAYTRLGLAPVTTVEKERRAADIDPRTYGIPQSAWDDGPAAGVVFRNKTGDRARRERPTLDGSAAASPLDGPANELAAAYATPERIEAAVDRRRASARPVTVEAVRDLVVEAVVREHYRRFVHDGTDVDPDAVRAAVARVVQRHLNDRDVT